MMRFLSILLKGLSSLVLLFLLLVLTCFFSPNGILDANTSFSDLATSHS